MSSNVTRQRPEPPTAPPPAARRAPEVLGFLRAGAWALCLLLSAAGCAEYLTVAPARYGMTWADAAGRAQAQLAGAFVFAFGFDRLTRYLDRRD